MLHGHGRREGRDSLFNAALHWVALPLLVAHERLLQADNEHNKAWLKYILARREWRLLQTFNVTSERAKRRPQNLALREVALIAEKRLLRFRYSRLTRLRSGSEVTSFWNPKGCLGLVADECGLARAFGLVYQAECRGLQGHKPI